MLSTACWCVVDEDVNSGEVLLNIKHPLSVLSAGFRAHVSLKDSGSMSDIKSGHRDLDLKPK